MPGRKGAKNVGANIREFHKGKTFKKTAKKFGKAKANKQAIAVGFAQAETQEEEAKKKTRR